MRSNESFLNRHPVFGVVLINTLILLSLAAIFEVVLRTQITYSLGYYTGTRKAGLKEYPFGNIVINPDGYADESFDLASRKPRVGYFGDSVNYGIGAGYPYRVSELVEQTFPEYEHWNLGGGVGGIFDEQKLLSDVERYRVDYAVYLLNLNDVFPLQPDAHDSAVLTIKRFVNDYLDVLRSRSYLYNYLRLKAKNTFQRFGFEASGYRAYELWPDENAAVFREFAGRVNQTARALRQQGRQMCVILLPYEMQVSAEAAAAYRGMGFTWEDGFDGGSPQRLLESLLTEPVVFDPLPYFSSSTAKLGEYFVYDKGDKIDWNHPTRAGHQVIADSFIAKSGCPFMTAAGKP